MTSAFAAMTAPSARNKIAARAAVTICRIGSPFGLGAAKVGQCPGVYFQGYPNGGIVV